MKYITSCPKCETQFMLHTEHIKAYRGKVQCGNCEHVFNAKNRLTEVSNDTNTTEENKANLDVNEDPIAEPILEEIVSTNTTSLEDNSEALAEDTPVVETAHANIKFAETPSTIDDLAFDSKFERKPKKLSLGYTLGTILLLLLAAIQITYFNRTRISSEYPQFKPLLVQVCSVFHCDVPLAKDLTMLLIDDSDMQESNQYKDVIHFSSTLINNASFIQAYPNIELTLTNVDDQPILRRLIQPSEYLKNVDIKQGIAPHEEVRIQLAINTSGVLVSGYRVILKY